MHGIVTIKRNLTDIVVTSIGQQDSKKLETLRAVDGGDNRPPIRRSAGNLMKSDHAISEVWRIRTLKLRTDHTLRKASTRKAANFCDLLEIPCPQIQSSPATDDLPDKKRAGSHPCGAEVYLIRIVGTGGTRKVIEGGNVVVVRRSLVQPDIA